MGSNKNKTFNQIAAVGTLGMSEAFKGPQKLGAGGAFKMTPEAAAAEREAILGLQAQASGQAPSLAAMQFQQNLNQAQMAQAQAAASARGINPALAFRAAADATGQMQAEAAGQSAMMAEEERRRAREALIQAAAAQRGVALQGAQANLASQGQYRQQGFDFLGNLGGSAAKATAGGK